MLPASLSSSHKVLAHPRLPLSSILLLVACSLTPTRAIVPTAPAPGDVFRAGRNCTIRWNTDSDAQWGNFSIDLMSGYNTNMSFVASVAQGLAGSDSGLSPLNWTCPEVDPYSAIYFYQFTAGDGDDVLKQWTTRFTLASPTGDSEPPAQSTQPEGDQIPWGAGHLVVNSGTDGHANSTDADAGETPTNTKSTTDYERGDEDSANETESDTTTSTTPRHHHHTKTRAIYSTSSPMSETPKQTPTSFASTSFANSASSMNAFSTIALLFVFLFVRATISP